MWTKDEHRAKALPVGVLEEWLKYPNTLQKVTGQDKQLIGLRAQVFGVCY
jgi:hypothetical protein